MVLLVYFCRSHYIYFLPTVLRFYFHCWSLGFKKILFSVFKSNLKHFILLVFIINASLLFIYLLTSYMPLLFTIAVSKVFRVLNVSSIDLPARPGTPVYLNFNIKSIFCFSWHDSNQDFTARGSYKERVKNKTHRWYNKHH